MTLKDPTLDSTYDWFKDLIRDLGLEDAFETEYGVPVDEYDADHSTTLIVRDLLENADESYVLLTTDRGPRFRVLRFDEE